MEEINIMRLLVINSLSTVEYNSVLIIDGEEVVKDTIYIYNKRNRKYLQLYYNGNEFIIYKSYDEIPKNDKPQRLEYVTHALRFLKGE